MDTCKAIIQEGIRRGSNCTYPPSENGYCGRHQRNKIYDDGVLEGKTWCRFFFRGCNTKISSDDKEKGIISCIECREKISKKKEYCAHDNCKFKVKEGKYCKKHIRDIYRDEEKEKGIKYCDIARGCFNLCKNAAVTCDTCLEKNRIVDSARNIQRKEMNEILQSTSHTDSRICTHCGKDYTMYKTRYGRESQLCESCNVTQKYQDKKRKDRVRNYKEEHSNNLENYYKNYIRDTPSRGYGDFLLNFEQFSTLVKSKCYYCNCLNEGEVNGIDRIDNSKGYTVENCVSACWTCNRMKHFYHPAFFVDKCKIIAKLQPASNEFFNKWKEYYSRSRFLTYNDYKKSAESRELSFDLTQQQWDWLTRDACYLCGYRQINGIGLDRVDNSQRCYTMDSCRPCCGSCNDMKGVLSLHIFLDQCCKISEMWPNTLSLESISTVVNPLKKGALSQEINRKHWKAQGLYYAILSNTAHSFYEGHKHVLSEKEYIELCATIKSSHRDIALDLLKKLINTLKKRKERKGHVPSPTQHLSDTP